MFFNKRDMGRSSIQAENELKQMELHNMTLTDQLDNFKKIAFKYQDEYNRLAKQISNFCMLLLDSEYARSQLGGNNSIKDMSVGQLMEFAENQYRTNHANERSLLINLTNQIKEKEIEIEGLKVQISQYLLKEQQLKEFGEPQVDFEEQSEKPVEKTPPVKQPPVLTPIIQESQSQKTQAIYKPNGIMRMAVLDEDEEEIQIMSTKPVPPARKQEPTNDHNNRSKQNQVHTTPAPAVENKPVVNPNPVVAVSEVETVVVETNIQEETEQKNLKNAETSTIMQSKPAVQPTVIIEDNEGEQQAAVVENIKTQVQAKVEHQKNPEVMAHVVNLNDTIEKMNDIMWDIVVAIGRDGLSESKDIKKAVVNNDQITESAFNTALQSLRTANVINQERVNTGWRWFYAFELSDIGNRIYLDKFKQNPVECEKQLLKKEHTTSLHGYCIKDTAQILKTVFGYDEAIIDRKANSMKLYSGETYIPDVVAKKKSGAVVDYFEVELGHHTQKDFNDKCEKMRMVSKDLYFIVPDAETMNKTLAKQVGQWVLEKGGKEKLKGTTIYLTTLTSLSKNKMENIYPF